MNRPTTANSDRPLFLFVCFFFFFFFFLIEEIKVRTGFESLWKQFCSLNPLKDSASYCQQTQSGSFEEKKQKTYGNNENKHNTKKLKPSIYYTWESVWTDPLSFYGPTGN